MQEGGNKREVFRSNTTIMILKMTFLYCNIIELDLRSAKAMVKVLCSCSRNQPQDQGHCINPPLRQSHRLQIVHSFKIQ